MGETPEHGNIEVGPNVDLEGGEVRHVGKERFQVLVIEPRPTAVQGDMDFLSKTKLLDMIAFIPGCLGVTREFGNMLPVPTDCL